MDEEGDRIEVTTEIEWTEMFSQLHGQIPIKLYFEKPKQIPDQKTSPICVPSPIQDTPVQPSLGVDPSSNVTKCLQQFFPNGIILPFNIPPFLSGVVNVINILGNSAVDLSVDITGLGDAIQEKGISDIDKKLYKEASHAFRAQGILQPNNPYPFFNVACAEALMGNTTDSLLFLNKAIDLGYHNLDHILHDDYLTNISYTKGFQLAIHRLRDILNVSSLPADSEPSVNILEPVKNPEPVIFEDPIKITEPVKGPEQVVTGPLNFQEPETVIPEAVIPPDFAYIAELEVLHDIGYLNDFIIVPVLEKNKGNIHKTVLELLDM
jgi:hypothetical protein